MGDGVKDAERHREHFPKVQQTPSWFEPVGMVDERHLFIWKQDLYSVVRHEEDNVIVHKIASKTANGTWQLIKPEYIREENFNPCASVYTKLGESNATK